MRRYNPTRGHYKRGERVLVEGVVEGWESGRPFGAVTVRFAEATDPSGLLDGVDAVLPQVVVHRLGVDVAAPNRSWLFDDDDPTPSFFD